MDNLITDLNIIDTKASAEEHCAIEISKEQDTGRTRKLYMESYGCAMNFADSEVVTSILHDNGFDTTSDYKLADVIMLNTCSIREKAENRVRTRLHQFNSIKREKPELIIGVLGCMAERLKKQLLEEERIVDLVAGPDAYRDLPNLLAQVDEGQKAVNTFLSREETYADISPVRLNSNGVNAFVSIMRGCDNMCSFCVVPFTRGRERSRDSQSIIKEATDLYNQGYKEVTLLGQNVDSYKWSRKSELNSTKDEINGAMKVVSFADLLGQVAGINPDLRVRFSTSHPKDITDDVLHVIKRHENICKYIHLPVQSGNSRVLKLMNRTYTRDWYLERVDKIREILGESCGISSDMITGFCSETEAEHQDTLSMMELVQYDFSYMFFYSERPGTLAAKNYADDIPLEIKKKRLAEVISKQAEISLKRNQLDLGKIQKVLIEGVSKRSKEHLQGRNTANKVVVFPKEHYKIGQYVNVLIKGCSPATLKGNVVAIV